MPSSQQILTTLSEISNKWQGIAIFWHLYFAVFAVILLMGVRPSKRIAGIFLGIPLLSVSVVAWFSGNLLSGSTFALSGIALMIIAIRLPADKVRLSSSWKMIAGLLMFFFGWIYPHFLDTESILPYLYSAPTGLIPCPTLSIVIGLSLLLGSFKSRMWSAIIGAMGTFYGLIGVVGLSLTLDLVLLLGASLILILAFSNKASKQSDMME